MSRPGSGRPFARRSFLSRLGIGLTAGGAALGTGIARAQTQSSGEGGRWQPARHTLDDWFDKVPGKHRFVLDTATPDAFGNALAFMNNAHMVPAGIVAVNRAQERGCSLATVG